MAGTEAETAEAEDSAEAVTAEAVSAAAGSAGLVGSVAEATAERMDMPRQLLKMYKCHPCSWPEESSSKLDSMWLSRLQTSATQHMCLHVQNQKV